MHGSPADDWYSFVDRTPFGVFVVDADFRLVRISAGAQATFAGVQPVLGREIAEVLRLVWPAHFATRMAERVRHTLCTGESYASNPADPQVTEDVGKEHVWQLERLTLPDGRPGVACFFRAETAVEARVRESEERSAFVRRSSGVGFWYCDLPFDVLQWDDLVKAHFHLLPHDTVTIATFYERIHPDDREPTRAAIEQSIAEHANYDTNYRTVHPVTGEVTYVRAIGRTFYAPDGTPTRFDGVTLDVTEQKRAEASLRESEQRFRVVADAAPVKIWLSACDGRHTWFNERWLSFTGLTMDEAVQQGSITAVHEDDVARYRQTYREAFDARAPFTMEYRLRRHDGEYRWLIDNGVPRWSASEEFEGYIGSCSDVTDYKSAVAALRDADRRKDEFMATLSHELRNPLAPLSTGLAVMRLLGPGDAVERTRTMMERQLSHLVRLVDDLLDVSRLQNDKLELRRERIALHTVIESAVETARPIIDEAGHDLTIDVPDEAIWLDGDITRLAQVLSNLLHNSAKYMQRGGRIRLRAWRGDGCAHVSVTDDGIGIPAAMLSAVFDRFTQVNRVVERSTGGLGIGLSLVKGLVERHGGTVQAYSEGEGRGSVFTVTLPVVGSGESAPVVTAR